MDPSNRVLEYELSPKRKCNVRSIGVVEAERCRHAGSFDVGVASNIPATWRGSGGRLAVDGCSYKTGVSG